MSNWSILFSLSGYIS